MKFPLWLWHSGFLYAFVSLFFVCLAYVSWSLNKQWGIATDVFLAVTYALFFYDKRVIAPRRKRQIEMLHRFECLSEALRKRAEDANKGMKL